MKTSNTGIHNLTIQLTFITWGAIGIIFLTGCGRSGSPSNFPELDRVRLESAESFELLSLDPAARDVGKQGDFHGWAVLGKARIADAEVRRRLVRALKQGCDDNDGEVARCFIPRHGIRVQQKDMITDYVICFECFQVYVYEGEEKKRDFLTTGSPQVVFDGVLLDAEVPLPKK